ncbi:MAG: 16S rRNA pseudouridine(516) synthase [Pseudomonadales bacterium]|nr:16S rRNA pseudouridine(516) synthase [Pseudomonadales bacterium]
MICAVHRCNLSCLALTLNPLLSTQPVNHYTGTQLISARTRLDRFISQHTSFSRRDVRLLLAQSRIEVDGVAVSDIQKIVHQFSQISVDGVSIQNNQPRYLMLNKPAGVVSATTDPQHKTVLDIIDAPFRNELHIAGRLDYNTTGLILLTNDGCWSRNLSLPENHIQKHYLVELENPVTAEYAELFAQGIYFEYEQITTAPAQLRVLSERMVELSITDGRYHQVKRMFGRFQNKVLVLHRYGVGNLQLGDLELGQYRELSAAEAGSIHRQD